MRRLMRKHWIGIGAGLTLLLLALIGGFLLRFRSVEALEQLVARLSNGQYKVQATSFRFNIFRFQVNARNVHVFPSTNNTLKSTFEFKADSLSIVVNNPVQLLLFKRLSVNELIVTSPYLEIKNQSDTTQNRKIGPIHHEVAAVQDVFFNVVSSLEVKRFKLTDGSFAIYPQIDQHDQRFFLNNIYLTLNDLHLLRKISEWDNTNRVSIDFQLHKPIIEYPDSSLQVVLEKLVWQSKARRFELTGLDFHKRLNGMKEKTGFRLENIELDSLNWNKLLTEGSLELGKLKAGKGYFSSNDIRFRRSSNKKQEGSENSLLDILGPIKVRELQIDSIQFTGNTYSRRGRESLEILGENFHVDNLIVDNALPNKIELDDLEMAVRGFLQADSSKSFLTGFDGMRIKKNQLILQNYFLRTFNRDHSGTNSIKTKQLILHNLSIPELLNGRLQSEELYLIEPEVRLELMENKSNKRSNPIEEIQRNIRRNLRIETIRIYDADLLITQGKQKKPLLQSTAFSAIISSNSVLRASTLEQLFNGRNRLEMPQLKLRLNKWTIDLENAVYDDNDLRAQRATGHNQNKSAQFDLSRVHIQDINAAGIIAAKDTSWIRLIELGSGQLTLNLNQGNAAKNSSAKSVPANILRMIRMGRIKLNITQGPLSLSTQIDSLAVDSLQHRQQSWAWDKYYLVGNRLFFQKENTSAAIDQYRFVNDNVGVAKGVQFSTNNDRQRIDLSAKELNIQGRLRSTNDAISHLQKITVHQPDIRVLLKESIPDDDTDTTTTSFTKLPAITLDEPNLELRKQTADSTIQLFSSKGGAMQVARVHAKAGSVETAKIELNLENIVALPASMHLKAQRLQLNAEDFRFNKTVTTKIQNLQIDRGEYKNETDEKTIVVNGIAVSNKAAIPFSSNKEQLRVFLKELPHLNLAADSVVFKNKTQQWQVWKPQANADNKRISLDSVQFKQLVDRTTYFSSHPYQTDYIEFSAGKSHIIGFDRTINNEDTLWKAHRMEFDKFNLEVARDKRYPMDSISYRPLLTDLIKHLPVQVDIESVLMTRSAIRYHEISEKTKKEGVVTFNDLNLVAGPIQNVQLSPTDSLKVTATAKFMGSGNLKFAFQQSYTDTLKGFLLLARMDKMEFNSLSPLLLPLFNLDITRGRMDSLWLRVKGNDYFAYGNMQMHYHKLKFNLLKENGDKKKFASFLANFIIRNKNTKKGVVFQERLRNKSTFNYWGKIALSGLLTNLGIKSNKKYSRKYKKEASRLQIPIELLE